jgi:hypothetical protein
MPRPSRLAVALTLAAGAAWFALARAGSTPFDVLFPWRALVLPPDEVQPAAHDVYAHFLPIMAYAGQALRAGGRGLLWTPLQNCGQPFAASNGLLYPLHWLPVLFGADAGLRLLIATNLFLGGVFAYLLGRELGARPAAALAGALAFELGNAAAHVAAWTPLVLEPFVWFPAVLLCVERLLRAPSARWAVGLGGACCMAFLPAWPQLVLFLYQLVALRVLWAFVVERPPRPLASLGAIGAGLLLGPLLDGIQLLPSLEVARESVRRLTLSMGEIVLARPYAFADFRAHLATGMAYGQPFSVIPCLLASLAFLGPSRRAVPLFYGAAGTLFFVLGLGPETPLFEAYLNLPGGRMFREPSRFIWVTGFCLSILVALGSEALAAMAERREGPIRWLAPVVVATVLFALQTGATGGLRGGEFGIGLAGVVVIALAALSPRFAPAALRAAVGLFVLALVLVPAYTGHNLYPSSASLQAHAALFARLRPRIDGTWRTYIVADDPLANRFALMHKSASLFGVPTVTDYEPQTAQRFAEFLVMMRTGTPMRSISAYYYAVRGWMAPGFNRNLLDLAAGRFLVVDAAADDVASVLTPPPQVIDHDAAARVYENPSALPRALWVPRLEVVREPRELLRRLAVRWVDPWQVALVDAPPASGFLGEPPAPDGSVPATRAPRPTFVRDDPEAIAIDVQAPARGFLLLADQHRHGWLATVNGAPAPIERANYAFRAVEVPAGHSRVEFTYAPRSLRLGALISAGALLAAAATLWRGRATRRRRAGTPEPAGSTR